jgi:hypothetical protein
MRLGYTLLAEADEAEGKWVAYQLLDSPVMVAARRVDCLYEVRIARPDKEHSDHWQRELGTMERFMGLFGWERRQDAEAKGFAMLYTRAVA